MKSMEKENFWKHHIAQAEIYNGSIAAYCRENSLGLSTFKYQRRQIERKDSGIRLSTPKSAFVPVKVKTDESVLTRKTLPDPKWIAEVIIEIHARFQ